MSEDEAFKEFVEMDDNGVPHYCKYCRIRFQEPDFGDGIYMCPECGYGIAPMENCSESSLDNRE